MNEEEIDRMQGILNRDVAVLGSDDARFMIDLILRLDLELLAAGPPEGIVKYGTGDCILRDPPNTLE